MCMTDLAIFVTNIKVFLSHRFKKFWFRMKTWMQNEIVRSLEEQIRIQSVLYQLELSP